MEMEIACKITLKEITFLLTAEKPIKKLFKKIPLFLLAPDVVRIRPGLDVTRKIG